MDGADPGDEEPGMDGRIEVDGEAEIPPVDRIEPGHPAVENVVFVLLGALGALYVIVRIAGLV